MTDEVPHRVLPRVAEPILTLVTNEVHAGVLLHEGDIMLLGVDVTRSLVASFLFLLFYIVYLNNH